MTIDKYINNLMQVHQQARQAPPNRVELYSELFKSIPTLVKLIKELQRQTRGLSHAAYKETTYLERIREQNNELLEMILRGEYEP